MADEIKFKALRFVHKDNDIGKRFYLKAGFAHIPEKDQDNDGTWKR